MVAPAPREGRPRATPALSALRTGWSRLQVASARPTFTGQRLRCSAEAGGCRVLERLSVKTFKSLDDVTVDLGLVNVFIGANGSGKSNLLEALGVLSAAADGKVDDQALLARGVRPGLPAQYKSAFPALPGGRIPPSSALHCMEPTSPVRSLATQSHEGSGTRLEIQDGAMARR